MSETANKFKIQVFNSSDPQAQYDAVTVKDQKTLYLLDMADGTAKAYLGYKPLAGGGGTGTVMGRLRETVFDAETATSDADLWGPNASITTVENHKYYTFSSPGSGGATASNPLYSTIMLSKPLAGFDELMITLNNNGLFEAKVPVSHLLHGDWCTVVPDDFTGSYIPTDVSYEYNETNGPRLKFRMRAQTVMNITTIEVVKYQEARVGKKRYKLISAPVEGLPSNANAIENCKEVVLSNIFTDYDEIEFVIEAYDTEYSSIMKSTYTPEELLTKGKAETEDVNLTLQTMLVTAASSGGNALCIVDRASKKKLYFYVYGNFTNARILAINGIKYETVTSDPITESYLRTLIDDIVSSKYVEYSIDDGTTQTNESVPVSNNESEPETNTESTPETTQSGGSSLEYR